MFSTVAEVSAESRRPLVVDDVLRMEDIGRVVLAPEGGNLVYEWIAPYESAPNLETLQSTTDRSALAKLFAIDLNASSEPRPLFMQETRGGYWVGGPSPDGTQLAVYRLLDGQVRAGVFDLVRKRLTLFDFTPHYSETLLQKPVWISDNELIYPAMPPGQQPSIIDRSALAARINELWQKAFRGVEPSATVLESTPAERAPTYALRSGKLLRVNARTGTATELSDGYFYNLRLSTGARYIAGLRETGIVPPERDRVPVALESIRRQLVIFDLGEGRQTFVPCPDCNIRLGTLAWSTDGARLVFATPSDAQPRTSSEWFEFVPWKNTLNRLRKDHLGLGCGGVLRVFANRMLVFGRLKDSDSKTTALADAVPHCDEKVRRDWLLLGGNSQPINLTTNFGSVSGNLVGITENALFVLADGDVWQLAANGRKRNITKNVGGPLSSWSIGLQHAYLRARDEIFTGSVTPTARTVLESENQIVTLDLETRKYTLINKPSHDAALVAVSRAGESAVFRQATHNVSQLLVVHRRTDASQPVLEINRYLDEVAEGRVVQIAYEVPGGETLSSCMLLPPDWTPTRRYPLVVHVYPDVTSGECWFSKLSQFDPTSLQLLAAKGYVVLNAATPKRLIQMPEGPTRGLTPLVLAAIDQAILEGYADAERLGLIGFSQGHHSALEVLTETNRFRAAIATHGMSNFSSHYGTTSLRDRFHTVTFQVGNAPRYEGSPALDGDTGLGVKLWEDPQRYVRNSPVFHADKIETPLLIIHSDFDDFPMGQSEEIFSALYRLRKEATYVTYWGEGHWNLSPANIRDIWNRIFVWLDEHLKRSNELGN